MIENHYGHVVDSEVPVTGVFQNNHVEWLWEDMHDMVCLADEDIQNEYIGEKITTIHNFLENYEHDHDYDKLCMYLEELDNPDLDSSDTSDWLIGFKKTDECKGAWYWFDNLGHGYIPDPDAECSAIVGEVYTQVVASKWVLRGALCSPCYPGQVDADYGDFMAYSLPPDYFEDNNPMITNHRIRRLEG